jgi:polyhydroxybutyrate depolymerase
MVQAVTSPVPEWFLPGTYALTLDTSDGNERSFILYLPDDYDETRPNPFPLVAMFHGLGGSALDFAVTLEASGLRTLADDQDKIGVILHARIGSSVTTAGAWDLTGAVKDDVLYTEELLDHLGAELNLDETRVFAAGHSLGGRFVHELGSRIPERFRAIADVSGFYSIQQGVGPAAPPAGTFLPVLIVHGTADLVVPIQGGAGSLFPLVLFDPTEVGYNAWFMNNGCTEPTTVINGIVSIIRRTHCDASRSSPAIEFVAVSALEHQWPDIPGENYDASSQMLVFFDNQ